MWLDLSGREWGGGDGLRCRSMEGFEQGSIMGHCVHRTFRKVLGDRGAMRQLDMEYQVPPFLKDLLAAC